MFPVQVHCGRSPEAWENAEILTEQVLPPALLTWLLTAGCRSCPVWPQRSGDVAVCTSASKCMSITSLPPQGQTGGFANGELICIAFLGIAAIHLEMNEPHADIAHKIATAVYADPETAKQWFGEDTIRRLLTVCPHCGTENTTGTKRCQHCKHQLLLSVSGTTPQPNTLSLSLPRSCSRGHANPIGSPICAGCGELITAAYCSLRHWNMPGESQCRQCGEPLAGSY